MSFILKDPIVIDTETFYDSKRAISVRKDLKRDWVGGNWAYVNHPEFYCYMLSWYDLTTHECGVIDSLPEIKAFLDKVSGRTMVGHNAGFDVAVCQRTNPDFQPFNTVDTADIAAYLQVGRSLAKAASLLLGIDVSKTERDEMDGQQPRHRSRHPAIPRSVCTRRGR